MRPVGHLQRLHDPESDQRPDVAGGALGGLRTSLVVLSIGTSAVMLAATLWLAVHSNHSDKSPESGPVATTPVRPAVVTPAPATTVQAPTSPPCWMFCTSGPGVAR